VEKRGHHKTAQRLRAFTDRVFHYAFVTLVRTANPAERMKMKQPHMVPSSRQALYC